MDLDDEVSKQSYTSNLTFEMKIGYKQQKSVSKRLYRDSKIRHTNFKWWLPLVNRQQVHEDESLNYTPFHLLRKSQKLKQRRRFSFIVESVLL